MYHCIIGSSSTACVGAVFSILVVLKLHDSIIPLSGQTRKTHSPPAELCFRGRGQLKKPRAWLFGMQLLGKGVHKYIDT